MESEKIIIVQNGLSDEFYDHLIEQEEAYQEYLDSLEPEDSFEDQIDEDHESPEMEYDPSEDEGFNEQEPDQDYDPSFEEQEPDQDYDSSFEEQEPDQDYDSSFEEQDPDPDQYYYTPRPKSVPDNRADVWIAVYNDYSTKSSENRASLTTKNLLCVIHKKYERPSRAGKTAYFSYHIVEGRLKMGEYACNGAESEHWTRWTYENEVIEEEHYLTFPQQTNLEYKFLRSFIFPIEYSFASMINLSKYNPFGFSFKKLNFMSENGASSCGDKLSRLKIIKSGTESFLEISIYDFQNNILPLLKELHNSASFIDFVIKIHLKHSLNYLERIKIDWIQNQNNWVKITFDKIVRFTESMIKQNAQYLPKLVKNDPKSELNALLENFNKLVNEIKNLK